MEILCFFAGSAFFYTKSLYPLSILFIAFFFRPRGHLLGWFAVAMFWSYGHQWWTQDENMPMQSIIKRASLLGEIISIPSTQGSKTQFQFRVDRLDGQPVKARVLLACYEHCPELQVGQYWRVTAKLRTPYNLANPGGFDYERWLKARHIRWTGSIQNNTLQLVATPASHYLLSLRQYLAEKQAQRTLSPEVLGIFQALTLGITSHISKESWDLFRRTGTTHLMVISGAHVGLVAGLSYWLMKWLWSRCGRMCLYYPAPKMGSIAALLMALLYALLAGFAVPAQRSLIACFFVFIRPFCQRRFGVWQGWQYALLVVLIFEPHAVMMPGFYLSFLAVAILLLTHQRVLLRGIRKVIAMQLACLFGLMPLTLFWFSYGAVNGFVANLLAIPWVGFILVPLSLLTTIFGQWFEMPWATVILNQSILYLLKYLYWVDSYSRFNLTFSFHQLLLPLAMMLVMAIVLFLPLKQFLPALLLLVLASFFPSYERVKEGEASIDVLDVGQGLAIVVKTAKHVLIYDTGAKLYRGSDMGKLVLIPYLKETGIKNIDKIVISHSDLDHRGGLSSLEEQYRIQELIVDDPAFYKRGSACHDYPAWSWEGVSFRFFAMTSTFASKNNRSCVLQIATQAGKMLLSGDIEKPAEDYLRQTYGKQLASSVLVVPHHGSKTSSTLLFVEQVAPQYAIMSLGFDNRYHFPHRDAMRVYQQEQIPLYSTTECGMIHVLLKEKAPLSKPECYIQRRIAAASHITPTKIIAN